MTDSIADGSSLPAEDAKVVRVGPVRMLGNPEGLFKRVCSGVRARIDLLMGAIYANRHPGRLVCRVIAAARFLIVWLSPNDKWSLAAHVPYWMKALDAPPVHPLPKSRRIFMYCAYRGQFTLDLVVAVLLAWRGHRITFGYLPKLQSPVREPLRDHSSAKPYLANILSRVSEFSNGRIRCVDLSEHHVREYPLDEAFIKSRTKSDVIMYFRRETLDRDDPQVQRILDYYEQQARRAQKLAWSYLQEHRDQYDLCLIANGTTFEGTQFCHVAKKIGMPINTYEKFQFRKVRTVNHGDDFLSFNDLNLAWDHRDSLEFTSEPFRSFAADQAYRLLEERRSASKATWSWVLQSAPAQSTTESLRAAGVPANTEFALVCPNVPFDAGYDGQLGLFDSMREWLFETVRHLLTNTSIHVVVRAHPAEAAHWGGRERSEETLATFLEHPRLTLISHDRPVNTYGLMETCKFGAVFSSTTGLEMAMMGKVVVVGGMRLYYAHKGFTRDCGTRHEYDAALTELAQKPGAVSLTEDHKQDARLFHFLLNYVMQWPFPYDKASCIRDWPVHRMLRSPDVSRYLPFFDALAIPQTEWPDKVSDFLTADGSNHIPVRVAD